MTWVLLGLAIVLTTVFATGRILAWRRTRDVRTWAQGLGLEFAAGPDRRVGIRYLELDLIGAGSAVARNLCSGRWRGREVEIFDLARGPVEDEEPACRRLYTCALVKAGMPLIPLVIRPSAAGPEDDGEVSKVFGDAFDVTSADRKWAEDLLHPTQTAWLLDRPGCHLELGGWFCLAAAPGRVGGEEIEDLLVTAAGFVDNVPDSVREEILGRGSGDAGRES